ncbi:TIGR04282 family arsenosugar biosynthesis glycosyltransferase [Aestuariirhabdus litorea]|uniref:Glycosyltransferase n=1 Tax=Aestuariirhabdus litorea TaxID=2528527 RepID=A0A3P3VQW9_9GAMM|nr:TIGR04282 family arsenosugar biosynthesis glycosyltransferase [Aestuariirhabdus litorea]RRJ85020.1 glycosyltransferase [Aestuariirhabdus litorea]RWW98245.1 DUF2064 domain-containing protein [Endozoicomonadaceae bacterium GTF-13]
MSLSKAILLFAKPPVSGRVKTRLIPSLGVEVATQVHAELLLHCASTLAQCPGVERQLWAGFDPQNPAFQEPVFKGWKRYLQVDGDLGDRMAAATAVALSHAQRAVVVGSDCPAMTPAYIEAAFEALEHHPVVLGPAEDGGYVLVGTRERVPELFQGIDWGSDRVLQQSRERLRKEGVGWVELETLWDVDRPEDFRRWRGR